MSLRLSAGNTDQEKHSCHTNPGELKSWDSYQIPILDQILQYETLIVAAMDLLFNEEGDRYCHCVLTKDSGMVAITAIVLDLFIRWTGERNLLKRIQRATIPERGTNALRKSTPLFWNVNWCHGILTFILDISISFFRTEIFVSVHSREQPYFFFIRSYFRRES